VGIDDGSGSQSPPAAPAAPPAPAAAPATAPPADAPPSALALAAAAMATPTPAPAPPMRPARSKRPWRSTTEEFGGERAAMSAELDEMLEEARTPFFDDLVRAREEKQKKEAGALARLGHKKK